MSKKVLFAVFVSLILFCSFSPQAAAQSSSCLQTTYWSATYGAFPGPGWFWYTQYPGTYAGIIARWKATCPAPAGPGESGNGPCCGTGGSPINLATGNTYIQQSDIKIPGLGGGLMLLRTWNSVWPSTQTASQVGLFGPNWRSNFEERVFVGSDNYIKYARGDGSFWSFGAGGPGWAVAAPANASATLVQGASFWTLTLQNGEQRLFDNTSRNLTTIIDRNGNTTQLSYDGIGRLTTVTDPVSRHLYFNYQNGSSYLVSSVTSDFGVTVSYSYDSENRLLQITEPDQSTLSFQYNSQSLITAVLDSNAKVLESHTYDSLGRGLTSSRANGVEALTITYH